MTQPGRPTQMVPLNHRSRVLVSVFLALAAIGIVVQADASPITITFTAGDVKEVMTAQYNDPLSDGTHLWGLWALRAMPIVTGGYKIVGGSVDDTITSGDFWNYVAPDASLAWAPPYGSEVAYFHLQMASEHLDTMAHPLYFIADQPASEFQNYAFDNAIDNGYRRSTYVGVCGIGGIAADDPRCNPTNILPDAALFSFTVDLDAGASLLGWQFLVDGSQFYLPGHQPVNWPSTSLWIQDFIGGDWQLPYLPYQQNEPGGGLTYDVGQGYQVVSPVPEPATLSLLGLGLAGAACAARRRASTR